MDVTTNNEQKAFFSQYKDLLSQRDLLMSKQFTYRSICGGILKAVTDSEQLLDESLVKGILITINEAENAVSEQLLIIELQKEIIANQLGDSIWDLLESANLI
ncbi:MULTISPECIES: hypothetical protein [Paenibacillus]|uniref:hypothetical protein n=1 Tax=Paenibacillus TaxID=44249 RepID=UPI0013537710|nr:MULTISPECIES: hypothetical protein [Paenibacillus]MDY8025803.1 hypothetical protein [Paenibacillus polymyxa]MXO77705.1 hypothetical protein [Paenibacillus sp. OT2-17]